jgi:hypothetical protein
MHMSLTLGSFRRPRPHSIDLAWDAIDLGGLNINDVSTFRIDHMPYGGVKQSGFGREGVRYAIEENTELKQLTYGIAVTGGRDGKLPAHQERHPAWGATTENSWDTTRRSAPELQTRRSLSLAAVFRIEEKSRRSVKRGAWPATARSQDECHRPFCDAQRRLSCVGML